MNEQRNVSQNALAQALHNIWGAFHWDDTPQGGDYWNQVVVNLEGYEDGSDEYAVDVVPTVAEAIDALYRAFIWDETEEGVTYWLTVAKNLGAI